MSGKETLGIIGSVVTVGAGVLAITAMFISSAEDRLTDLITGNQNLIVANQGTLTEQSGQMATFGADLREVKTVSNATDRYVRQNMPAFNELTAMLSDELAVVASNMGITGSDLLSVSTRMDQLASDIAAASDADFLVALRGEVDGLIDSTAEITVSHGELQAQMDELVSSVESEIGGLEALVRGMSMNLYSVPVQGPSGVPSDGSMMHIGPFVPGSSAENEIVRAIQRAGAAEGAVGNAWDRPVKTEVFGSLDEVVDYLGSLELDQQPATLSRIESSGEIVVQHRTTF